MQSRAREDKRMSAIHSMRSRVWLVGLVTLSLLAWTRIGHAAPPFTTLHAFSFSDGANSFADLLQGKDGAFYGTTSSGGTNSNGIFGDGTVFKITTSGLTTLYSFAGTDGATPDAGLLQGKDGALYGTTSSGGTHSNGTVFKITTSGALTTLYSFSALGSDGTNADGAQPVAGLLQGKDGALY